MGRRGGESRSDVPALGLAMATPLDRSRIGRLVCGDPDVDVAAPEASIFDLALAALTSTPFLFNVAEPALDGTLRVDPADLCDEDLTRWVEAVFDLPPWKGEVRPEPRWALLARLLESGALASRLNTADAPWSATALAFALRSQLGLGVDYGPPLQQAQRLARGIDVYQMSGFEPLHAGARALRLSCDDAQIDFRLDLSASASPYVRIDFGLILDGDEPMGRLYLDYGDGFSFTHHVLLWPRGRTRYAAFVATPGLRALRWKPNDAAATAILILLTARSMAIADLRDRLHTVAGARGLDRFDLLDRLSRTADTAGPFLYDLSRILTRDLGGHVGQRESYLDWLRRHELRGDSARRVWREELLKLPSKPLISVLVPTYDTDERFLREMIDSVQAQIYPNWELCIADDASRQPHVRNILESYARDDARIKLAFRETNGHISAATTTALELATGEWSALLDHDDVLRPHALLAVAKTINLHPDVQLIYSDEDKLDMDGERTQPFFKPDYSPELLLAQNYFNHLTVHRTANIRAVGGWRVGLEGSQDYDLNLRVIEKIDAAQIRHIPEVLYHWRIVAGSTSLATEEKSYASDAGLLAVREHLERTGQDAQVEMLPSRYYRVRHTLPTPPPMVSLIIPTRDRADLLAMSVGATLQKSTYPNYEIVIVDNGSVEAETKSYFKKIKKNKRVKVLEYDQPFNYSAINNFAAAQCRGDIIGLVNNDIEVISPDWIEELVSWAVQDGVGCVGAKLYYPDGQIQHAGVVLGIGGVAGHSHKYYDRTSSGYFSRLGVHHDVSAVTGACLFVRRSLFEAVGGLDETLAVAFNDVDFCLRVRALGYRNVFTPFAELYHHESVSRGDDQTPEKAARFRGEIELMRLRWENELRSDSYYSPNLSLEKEDYDLRWLDE
jgi:GT2 family glycosyltransferase